MIKYSGVSALHSTLYVVHFSNPDSHFSDMHYMYMELYVYTNVMAYSECALM